MKKILCVAVSVGLLVGANFACPAEPPPLGELIEKASAGDTAAQLSLAVRYRDGKGVARDNTEAMRWAHPVADRGTRQAVRRELLAVRRKIRHHDPVRRADDARAIVQDAAEGREPQLFAQIWRNRIDGVSSRSLGSLVTTPSPTRNRKYVRTAEIFRRIEAGASPRSFM